MNEFNKYLSLGIQVPGSYTGRMTNIQDPVRGFTIIELLVVILIMGLIVGITVPGFRSFTASNMLVSETNKVVSNLRLARQKAITQGIDIVITFHADHLNIGGTNIKLDHRVTLQKSKLDSGVPGAITMSFKGSASAFRKFVLIDDKDSEMKVIILPSGLLKSARG